MPRIILSLAIVLGSVGVLASGATGAFFSDSETSTGNTFAAGEVDLKIDNESYYNGNECKEVSPGVWEWVGPAAYPVAGTPCTTSWLLDDLSNGHLFFDFNDLKPDDEGEDTISIHVQNNSWACMDLSLTSNDDVSSTEPELASPDANEDVNNTWDGELAQNLQFFWWGDDGDNVYEVGEKPLTKNGGVQSLQDLATSTGQFSITLADATTNAWNLPNGTPIPANETVFIGKAWCFGTMTLDPVDAGDGVSPAVDPGVDCDGSALGNITQTDRATVDVVFRAEQARNNGRFRCQEEEAMAKITVTKVVVNDNGGNNIVSDFQLFLDGVVDVPLTSAVQVNVAPGSYTVAELGAQGYQADFGGDCDLDGNITLVADQVASCTITNNDIQPNVTLIKNVVNDDGGTAVATDFKMRVNGVLVPTGGSRSVNSNTNVTITEDAQAGYTATGISCPGFPGIALNVPFQLNEGVAMICTITNDDIGN